MLIRRQYAVVLPHKIVERDDRVHVRALTDQVHLAAVAEAEIARISRDEFIFESGGAVPGDAGRLAASGYILTNLAFLLEGAVGSLLVMTTDVGRIRHIHQFLSTLVGKCE